MIGTCPECGGKVSSQATTCPHCGVEISTCPECGEIIKYGVNQCPHCGIELSWGNTTTTNDTTSSSTQNENGDDEGCGFILFKLFFICVIGVIIWYCIDSCNGNTSSSVGNTTTEETSDDGDNSSMVGKTCTFTYLKVNYRIVFENEKRGTMYIDMSNWGEGNNSYLVNGEVPGVEPGAKATLKFSYSDLRNGPSSDYVYINISDNGILSSICNLPTQLLYSDGYIYGSATACNAKDTTQGIKCNISE